MNSSSPFLIFFLLILFSVVNAANLRSIRDHDIERHLISLMAAFHDPKSVAMKEYAFDTSEAMKNGNAPLSGRHVIFTTFQPATGAASDYKLDHSMFKEIVESTHTLLYPNWHVHVLVGDDKSIDMLAPRPGLQVVDYRKSPTSERLEKFKDTFVSQTMNDLSSENFRIRRWILTADYLDYLSMNGIPMTQILTLDSDVALIKDPLLVDKLVDWEGIQSYKIISGAAVLWSLHGINSFAHFMLDAYSSREKAAKLVKKYGKTVKGCGRGGHVALIPCFTPKGESDLHMVHMTDTLWYNAWADLNPISRIKKSPKTMDCLVISRLGDKDFKFIHKESDVVNEKTPNDGAYCIIHFQGDYKQYVRPFLSFVHDQSSSYSLDASIDGNNEGDNLDLEGYPLAAYESLKNDGAPLSGRHVIFTLFSPNNGAASGYKVNYTLIEAIVDSTIKLLFPEWRIHVLVNIDEVIEVLTPREGLSVVDYRRAPSSERLQKFDATYVSQTVNDLAFEEFCMLRWNLVADYLNYLTLNEVPVKQIVTLDSDVVLIKDPLLVDKAVDWENIESYGIINGAAVSWTLQGMNSFVDFMVDSYSSREKAVELVKKHGKTFKGCSGDDHAALIACFIPDGQTDLHMLHMSDMHWYNTWVEQKPLSRIQRSKDTMDCIVVGELGSRNFNFIHQNNGTDIVEDTSQNEGTYCMVHFQGEYKKYVMSFLSFVHGNESSYYLNTALDLLYAKPVDVKVEGDNSVLEGYPMAAFEATKTGSSHPSGRHVIFAIVQPDSGPIDYTTIEAIVDSTVKLLSPYWLAHVLVGDDKSLDVLTPRRGLQVVDYRRAPPSERLQRFDATYVSQTINAISFERFCMRRWILISDYVDYLSMNGVPVDQFITLEEDAVLIKDPLIVDHSVDWTGIESYSIINGAVVSWTPQGMNSFVDFLLASYSSRGKAAELVKEYGKTIKGCATGDHVALIPCFTPKGQLDLHMVHMSDSHWYNAWADQNPSSRVQKLLNTMDCTVVGGLGDRNFNFIHKGADIVLDNAQNDGAYCMVHFQGEYKKYILSFLAFVHGEVASYHLDTSLELLNEKSNPVQVKVKAQELATAEDFTVAASEATKNERVEEVKVENQNMVTTEDFALTASKATKNSNTQSTGRHIIFTIFQPDDALKSNYILDYTGIKAIVESTVQLLSPDWLVHVLVNDDTAIDILTSIKGLQVVDYRKAPPSERIQDFDTTYVSQTMNPISFERFCMRRWILIADYLHLLTLNEDPVNQVITLDTDVVLMKDPLRVDKSVDWTGIESYRILNGAAVSWSLQGMNSFVYFLVDSYSSREKAAALVMKYGQTIKGCAKGDHVALIPCFTPKGKSDEYMWHISDMQWFNAWAARKPSLRIQKDTDTMDCLVVGGLGDKNFNFIHSGNDIIVKDQSLSEGAYCMVHFQGLYKKYLLSFLEFVHGKVPSYYLDTADELLHKNVDEVKVKGQNLAVDADKLPGKEAGEVKIEGKQLSVDDYTMAASEAARNDGIHFLSGRHVIIALFQPENGLASDFKLNYTSIEAIVASTVNLLFPHWRVHVLVNDDEAIEIITSRRGLLVVDYRKAPPSERLQKFDATYVSQTINPVSFEQFGMRRWILISDYVDYLSVNGVPINHIITLDSDVVLIQDPLLVDKSADWTGIASYSIINGAVVSWTLEGINSFVAFLLESYSIKKKAAELVGKHGKIMKGCEKGDHVALIPCFTPDGSSDLYMLHMTDRHWYNVWADEKRSSRIRKSPERMDCIVISGLGDKNFSFIKDKGGNIVEESLQSEKAYCMVHFQGLYKKYILPFLSFIHGDLSSYHLDTGTALLA